MKWSKEDLRELIRLHRTGNYLWKEMAELMGRKPVSVRNQARKLGLKLSPSLRARMGKWNIKHKHLREPVMKYFLTHSLQDTAKHFGLTLSEIKSIFTVGYRDPKLKHLRKETRPHSAWSDRDWIFMVRHSGIMPREWIGRKLKRGTTYHSVKDALAKFRGLGKYMNGMPVGWAQGIFEDQYEQSIKTKAGPTGCSKRNSNFRYRLIPWVQLDQVIKKRKTTPEIQMAIQSMARFQRWIHGNKKDREIIRAIHQMLLRRGTGTGT